jgi:hypothetical protein
MWYSHRLRLFKQTKSYMKMEKGDLLHFLLELYDCLD